MASGFKVIIAGGGIAGLTLANALEKANIDYVLLERRLDITPQVGASIGILPNGCRIMDQLGCRKELYEVVEPILWMHDRDKNGKPLARANDVAQLTESRTGYDIAFGDRQKILEVLYNNLKDKSKVLVGKNSSLVRHHSSGVTVICEDGSSYTGDILAGADGVNSKARSEMWRLADEVDPELVKKDKDSLVCQYQCLFGIASSAVGMKPGDMEIGYDKNRSTLVIVAKEDCSYYFAFEKLDKIYKPPNIPVYTKEDMHRFAEKHDSMKITERITLKDIRAHATSSTLVGVETATYKIWTWGRIACVGDASHKMTPNAGFGGNAAMESAAALANSIKKTVDITTDGRPTYEQVVACLERYQKSREIRAAAAIEASNFLTHVQAFATYGHVLFAKYGLGVCGDFLENLGADMSVGAEMLDYLPPPEKSLTGTLPFNPEQGEGHKPSLLKRALLALPLLALSAYGWDKVHPTSVVHAIEDIVKSGQMPLASSPIPLLQSFLGIKAVDLATTVRNVFLSPAVFGYDAAARPQLLSFLTDFGVIIAIWSVEAVRRCNVLMPTQLPGVFEFFAQTMNTSVVAPFYFFVHWTLSPIDSFKGSDMRLTRISRTRSVLPSLLLAYYLPLFASFFWPNLYQRQGWLHFWQYFPIWHFIGQKFISRFFEDTLDNDKIRAPKRDVPAIRHAVGLPVALSAIVWIATALTTSVPLFTTWTPFRPLSPLSQFVLPIRETMKLNQLLVFGSTYLWLAYFVWDAKYAGMVNDSWAKIAALMAVGTFAIGPGATAGLAWLWREYIITEKRHKAAVTVESVKRRAEAEKIEANGQMHGKA